MELRPDDIAEILRIFDESELVELRIEVGTTRLYLSKVADRSEPFPDPAAAAPDKAGNAPKAQAAAPKTAAPDGAGGSVDGLVELRSPLLGVFYRRPAPDQPPFVDVGSIVRDEDPVCIIDVMKMFTRVPAGANGRIAEICIEDGTLVEHGQVIIRIEPR